MKRLRFILNTSIVLLLLIFQSKIIAKPCLSACFMPAQQKTQLIIEKYPFFLADSMILPFSQQEETSHSLNCAHLGHCFHQSLANMDTPFLPFGVKFYSFFSLSFDSSILILQYFAFEILKPPTV